jgi:hypothetical protein
MCTRKSRKLQNTGHCDGDPKLVVDKCRLERIYIRNEDRTPRNAITLPPTSEAAFDLVAKRDNQVPFCGGDDTKDGVVWEPKLEATQASAQGVSPWKGTVGWKGVQFGANGAWEKFCKIQDCTVSHYDPVPSET